jgi:hypothetical protein
MRHTQIVFSFALLLIVPFAWAEQACPRDEAVVLAGDPSEGLNYCTCPQIDCTQRRITLAGCTVSCSNGQRAKCECADPTACARGTDLRRQTCTCGR